MSNKASNFWLFFLFNLPGTRASERVKFWRRLKKFGAIQLKTSAYVLPDEPTHYERFQWLSKEILDVGGDATLARVAELENMPYAAVVSLFNDARTKDYNEIAEPLLGLIKDRKACKANPDAFVNQLQKLKGRFQEIQDIDYFRCPRAEDIQRLFQKAEGLESPTKHVEAAKRLQAADYKGKLWLTRPRPEIDRVGSAWFIRKFLDPEAKFVFADSPLHNRRLSHTTC
jgi:ChrB-like protein/chromate resistance exported protein